MLMELQGVGPLTTPSRTRRGAAGHRLQTPGLDESIDSDGVLKIEQGIIDCWTIEIHPRGIQSAAAAFFSLVIIICLRLLICILILYIYIFAYFTFQKHHNLFSHFLKYMPA